MWNVVWPGFSFCGYSHVLSRIFPVTELKVQAAGKWSINLHISLSIQLRILGVEETVKLVDKMVDNKIHEAQGQIPEEHQTQIVKYRLNYYCFLINMAPLNLTRVLL